MTVPRPPAWLKNAEAAKRWRAKAPELARKGPIDLETFGTYCQVWARWRKAEAGIAQVGNLVKRGGKAVANPLIAIAKDAARQVRELERQLRIDELEAPAAGLEAQGAGLEGRLLTRRELADLIPTHMQTITKWEQAGMPTAERGRRGKPSRYREADVRGWLEARDRKAAAGGAVDLTRERARRELAQAVLFEQKFQKEAGLLVPAADVERTWSKFVHATRTKLLALPETLAEPLHRTAMLEGVDAFEAALYTAIVEALLELSGTRASSGSNGDGSPAPPAEADEISRTA